MRQASDAREFLPLPLPGQQGERAALVILRRMAAHGQRDASATMLALETWGRDFRRVLVLLRAFMVELARASDRTIRLAPCCAMRMTEDEGLVMEVLALAAEDPEAAGRSMMLLAGSPRIGEPLSVACVLSVALRGI